MAFLFGTPIQIDILLDNDHEKQKVTKIVNKQKTEIPIYMKNEDIKGKVVITLKDKKYEHQGIKIDFIGSIEYSYDRSSTSNFIQQTVELSRPNIILEEKTMYPFSFSGIDKKYDSYSGKNVRLRYYLRVSVNKKYSSGLSKEQEIWVINYQDEPTKNDPILMDVGVEKCVSIEFKYAKSYYNLTDVVLGQVYFKVVRLPLASMELQIQRKETTGFPPNQTVDTEVLSRYELMDGAPVKGESMPIRVFLANLDLTPSYHNVNNMFSVTYHLHLVLIEEDGKRYFKQCEFKLWRKQPQPIKTSPNAPISVNTDCLAGSQETPYKGSDINKPLPEVQSQQSIQEEPKEEIKEPVIEQPQQSIQEESKEEKKEEEPKEEKKEEPKAIDISSFIQDDKQDDDNLF
ncbi:vacuolar protein sorting-associated protein, putative [Entamoeba dispar SAW760]|uniref:Vacuolar protein sorting-associated protein, putative n=1 Tax=Entamoeba dispar (strain ATCC PRA-260 / SAW760) TaxID=370354 RepID=B0E6P1_ENTDS|nr:vacuolar protein sorting-associated protein, putative [Entamoeba dispar SAW760]EDR29795.1 vacuolar protein sorting-associated protein, putative [Entamoeba dispar SAW760]|eukprot:EDR29795.1 vacuolar protein sorting-associated protein, putative [Entamoeba dispar SAW760]